MRKLQLTTLLEYLYKRLFIFKLIVSIIKHLLPDYKKSSEKKLGFCSNIPIMERIIDTFQKFLAYQLTMAQVVRLSHFTIF